MLEFPARGRNSPASAKSDLESGEGVTGGGEPRAALHAMEAALVWSESLFRELIERSPEIVLVIEEGRVVYANAALVRSVGAASAEALLGREAIALVHPDDREAYRERLRRVVATNAAVEPRKVRCVRDDGTDLWMDQPPAQRRAGAARRHGRAQHHPRGDPHQPRRAGVHRGARQRRGHRAGAPRPDLRPLLHHAPGRPGHRPRALHLPRHHLGPRRRDHRCERARAGGQLRGVAARRAGGGRTGGDAAGDHRDPQARRSHPRGRRRPQWCAPPCGVCSSATTR